MSARMNGWWLAAIAILLCAGPARGEIPTPDGVVCLTPVLERSYIAVELPLAAGVTTSALQWFNNDGEVAFPEVLICGINEAGEPDLEHPVARMENVSGQSSGWSTLALASALTGSESRLFGVFRMPANTEREGLGAGGGPGVGYWAMGGGPATFLGGPEEGWVRLSPRFRVAVAPVVAGKAFEFATARPAPVAEKPPVLETSGEVRLETGLAPPIPNPANPAVEIRFTLANPGVARVSLFNLRGERVTTLVDGAVSAGQHVINWRGTDSAGNRVASGVYLLRLEAGGQTFLRRVTLVR